MISIHPKQINSHAIHDNYSSEISEYFIVDSFKTIIYNELIVLITYNERTLNAKN